MDTLLVSEVANLSSMLSRDYQIKTVDEDNFNFDFSDNNCLIISGTNKMISKKTINNINKTIEFEFYRMADMMYDIELLSKDADNIENITLKCSSTKLIFNNITELKNCFTINNPFFNGKLEFICIKLIVKFVNNVEEDIQFKCNLLAFSNEIRKPFYVNNTSAIYQNKNYMYTHGELWRV